MRARLDPCTNSSFLRSLGWVPTLCCAAMRVAAEQPSIIMQHQVRCGALSVRSPCPPNPGAVCLAPP